MLTRSLALGDIEKECNRSPQSPLSSRRTLRIRKQLEHEHDMAIKSDLRVTIIHSNFLFPFSLSFPLY